MILVFNRYLYMKPIHCSKELDFKERINFINKSFSSGEIVQHFDISVTFIFKYTTLIIFILLRICACTAYVAVLDGSQS